MGIAPPLSAQPNPCANQQPCNDDYINSLSLNDPGKKLDDKDTLKDVRNTSTATTQSDLFSPPSHGGPAEITTCDGVSYGKTIWYDFYPNRDGTVRIRTSGFDNVIALYRFRNPSNPIFIGGPQCVHQSSFPNEEFDAKVKKGSDYTIQIGGVNNTGGMLEFLFDFFANPPHRLTAQSTLSARATSTGVQIVGLSVSTARTAHVHVSCGRFCSPQSKTGHATENFPGLKAVSMPAGSALTIRVTAPHSIGAYIQYQILKGNFAKITRCTEPGSRKPRRTCH
jgi:hypothetical protein